ncbi:TrmH family RNA methyltransferase [Bacillus pinisoli]|uniref:TrmH family RNA methyltransferase n=1 Tax=Bacillus pinisoli TaxID=2901866 RepID=UPI001FF65CCB|nr:RNA methyltransferase [Bacillus pinisoli]
MKRIESKKNPQVKQWKKLQTKKERDKTDLFIIEGAHLVEEALKYTGIVVELLYAESFQLPYSWNLDGIDLFLVTDDILHEIGDTETPQGVAAICRKPNVTLDNDLSSALLIDAVQDPGNLGTLIRTADAAGIDQIIIGDGTVDIFNSKVLRASQGSIFHIPISRGNLSEWIEKLKSSGHAVYGTSLEGAEPYQQVHHAGPFALIVGNEGRGVQKELLSQTTQNLYIPIYGKAESLNVTIAAGILLYYLRG